MKTTVLNYSAVIICLAAGCATPPSSPAVEQRRHDLSISDLERLHPGEATATQISQELGKPDQIMPLRGEDQGLVLWSYERIDSSGVRREANFTIDPKAGSLIASTWVPAVSDPLIHLDSVLVHFNRSHFVAKKVGWIAKHEYLDDAVYSDPTTGISMYVRYVHQDIVGIFFQKPQTAPLAKQTKSL